MKDPSELKIVSFNIGSVMNELRRARIFDYLGHCQDLKAVDVLCLQEVYMTWQEKESLQDSLKMEGFPYFAFGENAQFKRGCMGNVTLSRHPIEESESFDLSQKGRESRGCVETSIRLADSRLFRILNVHLGLRAWERKKQFQFLSHYIGEFPDKSRMILAGDFNDWKGVLHSIAIEGGVIFDAGETYCKKLVKTFPSLCPCLPLDRIYFKNLKLKEFTRLTRGWRAISDHLPITATFSES